MQQIVLIGDSIRAGYEPFVIDKLRGLADVWGPEANGGDSAKVRAHLREWASSRRADVIHLNCGLHDIKRPFDSDANQVPLPQYRENVRAILTALQHDSGARIVWATTTPVNHQWHHDNKEFDRFEEDVVAYNEVATELAVGLGIEINDLYTVIVDAGRDGLLREDGVHFTPDGSRLLAGAVVEAIRR